MPGASAERGGHGLDAVLLIDDPLWYARRSDRGSRQAWARKDHLVELRAWGGHRAIGVIVEALCVHTCLRAVFVGCGRSLEDHTPAEAAAVLARAVKEHAERCPDSGRIRQRVVKLA